MIFKPVLEEDEESLIQFYKGRLRKEGFNFVRERLDFLRSEGDHRLHQLSTMMSIARWENYAEDCAEGINVNTTVKIRYSAACGLCVYHGLGLNPPERCTSREVSCILYDEDNHGCSTVFHRHRGDHGAALIIALREGYRQTFYGKEEKMEKEMIMAGDFKASFVRVTDEWWVMQITEMSERFRRKSPIFTGSEGNRISSECHPEAAYDEFYVRGSDTSEDMRICKVANKNIPWIFTLLNEWKDSFAPKRTTETPTCDFTFNLSD